MFNKLIYNMMCVKGRKKKPTQANINTPPAITIAENKRRITSQAIDLKQIQIQKAHSNNA